MYAIKQIIGMERMCLASYDDPESLSTPNGTTSSEPVKEEEAQKQGRKTHEALRHISFEEMFNEIKDEDEKISAEKMKELGLNDGTDEGEEVSELAKLVGNNEEVAKLIYDKVKDGGIASSADLEAEVNKILNGNENIDKTKDYKTVENKEIMRDSDANMSGGNKVTENLLERFSSSPIGGAMKEILKWILKIPFIGNLVGGYLGLEGKDGREMANNLDSLSDNYNSFKVLKNLGQIRDKSGSLVSSGEKPFEGKKMDFNFEDVKEKMKEVKELVGHDLSKKEWIQAFNGGLEYGEKKKKLEFKFEGNELSDDKLDGNEMEKILDGGVNMVENNQNSVDTTQSDKNDENKAETNSSIESKTKEEKQKEAEHEPIELKESPDKKGTFTAEIKGKPIEFKVKEDKDGSKVEGFLTVDINKNKNPEIFKILENSQIKIGNDIYSVYSSSNNIEFYAPKNILNKLVNNISFLEEQDKTNIMNLIEKIFSTDNPQVRVFYSIVHNKLTSLNYLDTNQSPNLLLVEQSLQMKKLDPNFVIPKSTKDALSKDRKNNEFKKVNEKLKEQGFDWSNDLDKSLYYKYVTKTWTQTQELPLNADQKEESQTLISNKDFSGINKKLTNWFIEGLKTLITKKT